jgi:hypothetical protein
MERENLAGDAKGKVQAAPTARPKVPMRRCQGKSASGANREAESTDAPERGGLLRISDEAG